MGTSPFHWVSLASVNRSLLPLVRTGRSQLAGLSADFLNKGKHHSFPQQRTGARTEKDSRQKYHVPSQSVTPETATLLVQHQGNSHGLLCGGLYHQAWGVWRFLLLWLVSWGSLPHKAAAQPTGLISAWKCHMKGWKALREQQPQGAWEDRARRET